MAWLLAWPAVVALALPFFVALVLALWLASLRLAGLAAVAGYAVSHVLIAGIGWPPTGGIARLWLCALAAAPLGAALDRTGPRASWPGILLLLLAAGAAVWVQWPALRYLSLPSLAIGVVVGASYCALIAALFERMHDAPERCGPALVSFAAATGGAALYSASGLMGELGTALAAASTAVFAVAVAGGSGFAPGRAFAFGAGLPVALLGVLAWRLASMRWYVLGMLAVIPFAALLPLPRRWPPALRAALLLLLSGALAGASIAVVRRFEGGLPF